MATDEAVSESRRQQVVTQYGDEAVQFLREAVRLGFKDARQLENREFDTIWTRDDFQKLLAELGQNP